jgi:hypothetical protein
MSEAGRGQPGLRIFISYSHHDKKWLLDEPHDLIPWLERNLHRDNAQLRYDRDLDKHIGERFWPKLVEWINEADIVILMLSQNFVASEFVEKRELPWIKERLDAGELSVIPILVGPIDWEGDTALGWIVDRQIVPSSTTPLSEYASSPGRYEQARVEVLKAIRQRIRAQTQCLEPQPGGKAVAVQNGGVRAARGEPATPHPASTVLLASPSAARQTADLNGDGRAKQRPPAARWWRRPLVWPLVGLGVIVAGFLAARTPVGQRWYGRVELLLRGPVVDLRAERLERTFVPIANLPWLHYGHDFGAVPNWSWDGVSRRTDEVDATLARLASDGVRGVVWFVFGDGRAAPEIDADGLVSGLDEAFWRDYDTAVALACKHDIGVLWVLVDASWFRPAEKRGQAALSGRGDTLAVPAKLDTFINRALRPLVRRYAHERHIIGWVILNEPEHAIKEGLVSVDAVRELVRRAGAVIHAEAPRQPVSVASADMESLVDVWATADLDFFVFHHYRDYLPPSIARVRALLRHGTRPVFLGEFDADRSTGGGAGPFVAACAVRGYAGAWPWPKASHDDASAGAAPVLAAWSADYAAAVAAARGSFPSGSSPGAEAAAVPSETDRVRISADLTTWGTAARVEEQAHQENKAWRDRTATLLEEKRVELADRERVERELASQLKENEDWHSRSQAAVVRLRAQIAEAETRLRELGARLASAANAATRAETQKECDGLTASRTEAITYVGEEQRNVAAADARVRNLRPRAAEVRRHLSGLRATIAEQERHLTEAEAATRLHASLLEWHRLHLRQAPRLYIEGAQPSASAK